MKAWKLLIGALLVLGLASPVLWVGGETFFGGSELTGDGVPAADEPLGEPLIGSEDARRKAGLRGREGAAADEGADAIREANRKLIGSGRAEVTFRGVVQAPDGKLPPGLKVTFVPADFDPRDRWAVLPEAAVQQDGRVRLELPAGRYHISVRGPDLVGERVDVLVDGSVMAPVELHAKRYGTLRVRLERDGKPYDRPLLISLQRVSGRGVTSAETGTWTGREAWIDLKNLQPGTYRLACAATDGSGLRIRSGVVDVESGKAAHLTLRMPEATRVFGRVTSEGSGAGIAGAKGIIELNPGVRLHYTLHQAFTTDADGFYDVELPRGHVERVRVEASGYAPWVASPSDTDSDLGVMESLGKPGPHRYDVQLGKGVTLDGYVEDQQGNPVAGVRMVLHHLGHLDLAYGGTSDAEGRVKIEHLALGEYRVVVIAEGTIPLVTSHDDPRAYITGEVDVYQFTATVDRVTDIRGRVVDVQGRGVAAARVWAIPEARFPRHVEDLMPDAPPPPHETFTAHDGSFVLRSVSRTSDMVLRAERAAAQADPVALRPADDDTPEHPITLVLRETAVVTGVILDRDTGRPVAATRVGASPMSPGRQGAPRLTRTDAKGEFSFSGLIPGAWRFRALDSLEEGNEGTRVQIERVPVHVKLSLDAGLAYSGVIRGADGQPLGRALVVVARVLQGKQTHHWVAWTDAQGRFEITGVHGGESYELSVKHEQHQPHARKGLSTSLDHLDIQLEAE